MKTTLRPPGAAAIEDLRIQFTGLPAGAERAGLLVRNFRFEPAPSEGPSGP